MDQYTKPYLLNQKRVLSIQSLVVSGYVGNRAATLPLQLHGFDVDTLNTVSLSNHTQYPVVKGTRMKPEEFDDLIQGLEANNLLNYNYLLTGYIGVSATLERVANVVDKLRQGNPSFIYMCDPVMGDNGKFYVPQDSLQVYQEKIIPKATIITPNSSEMQWLTGLPINSDLEAYQASCKIFEKYGEEGPKIVIISSVDYQTDEQFATTLAVERATYRSRYLKIKAPKYDRQFTGTGDIFSALNLVWLSQNGMDLEDSIVKTLSSMQRLMKDTFEQKSFELQLIQNIDFIKNPQNNSDIISKWIDVKQEFN